MIAKIAELPQALRELGLGQYEAAITAVARPALALHLEPEQDSELPIGSSKFGGDPDLGPNVAWPMRKLADDKGEEPLQFLVQFNLEELAHYEAATSFPRHGLLSFFYDIYDQPWGFPEDHGAWHILYQSSSRDLKRRPSGPPPKGKRYKVASMREFNPHIPVGHDDCHVIPRRVSFTEFLSFPNHWSLQSAETFAQGWDEESAGFSVAPSDQTNLAGLYTLPFQIGNQLFGYPAEIQNPMEPECERALLLSNGGDAPGYYDVSPEQIRSWKLLLQIDSFEELMWGDVGMIFFWIRQEDLATSRFDQSWLQLQCF